jgi:hypothetical protein
MQHQIRFVALIFVLLFCASGAKAQAVYEYLGAGKAVPDSTSPTLGIRFNSDGLEYVSAKKLAKSEKMLESLNAPAGQITKLLAYPNRNYGEIIERSYRAALASFTACGGSMATSALSFDPSTYYIQIEPTIFTDEVNFPGSWLAGETLPGENLVKVVGFYKSQSDGELAYLPAVMTWEAGNMIAAHVGIPGEPRGANWPCR